MQVQIIRRHFKGSQLFLKFHEIGFTYLLLMKLKQLNYLSLSISHVGIIMLHRVYDWNTEPELNRQPGVCGLFKFY